jgi:HK97 family phage portal protein
LMSVSISEEAKKFTNSLLTNHMTPSASIVVKNSIKTEAEAKLIKDKIAEQYSGNNRGKSIVTFGDVDIKNISTKMRDETVLELCEYCKKEITALFGVPLDLLDQSNSNRASILSAKTNFYKMTIFPLANDICDQLSRFIAKEYDTSFLLGFDTQESIENDPQEQADLFKTYIDAGIITKEEAREKLGL